MRLCRNFALAKNRSSPVKCSREYGNIHLLPLFFHCDPLLVEAPVALLRDFSCPLHLSRLDIDGQSSFSFSNCYCTPYRKPPPQKRTKPLRQTSFVAKWSVIKTRFQLFHSLLNPSVFVNTINILAIVGGVELGLLSLVKEEDARDFCAALCRLRNSVWYILLAIVCTLNAG